MVFAYYQALRSSPLARSIFDLSPCSLTKAMMVPDYALIGEITWGQTEFLVQASTTSYCFSQARVEPPPSQSIRQLENFVAVVTGCL